MGDKTGVITGNNKGSILISHGRVIDPGNNRDEVLTIHVEDGIIKSISKERPEEGSFDTEIDTEGKWVTPGLIDMHVHLREPGQEEKETIRTGTKAASAGGFTAVACMPNTSPVLDEESKIRYVLQRGEDSTCRVYPVGSMTKNLEGVELSPYGEMVRAGAKAFSDDGKSVARNDVMKNAFNYSKSFDIPLLCHSELEDLSSGGHMNEGNLSTELGLKGIPSISEEICVARDIMLAEYTGARVHICHVSTRGAIDLIRAAKERGVNVTSETCPHYFSFTDQDCREYNTAMKMKPPLRRPEDRDAVVEGIRSGVIDVIASDHAPHAKEDKDTEFETAAFGVIGLETMVPAVITKLLKPGVISPADFVRMLSINPASILREEGGDISEGKRADITVIDPEAVRVIDPEKFYSKGRYSPFNGMELTGFAVATIKDGGLVYCCGS
ncbi:MAG: dihydroorotase [Chitinivibrionales bacterium]